MPNIAGWPPANPRMPDKHHHESLAPPSITAPWPFAMSHSPLTEANLTQKPTNVNTRSDTAENRIDIQSETF